MALLLSMLSPLPTWISNVLAVVFTVLLTLVIQVLPRQPLPVNAPKLLRGWPILGCLGFFRSRRDFLLAGSAQSRTGHFSFYCGSHLVIAISGEAARATHYTVRGLDLVSGFNILSGIVPPTSHLYGGGDSTKYFFKTLNQLVHRDHLSRNLCKVVEDVEVALQGIQNEDLIEPFDLMFCTMYKVTNRLFGCNDIADDPNLLRKTLAYFRQMSSVSATQIMFPYLPTLSGILKQVASARLYWTLVGIIRQRRRTGRREDDAMQMMIDQGDSDSIISVFIIGVLFTGLINTGVNASSILCYFAQDNYWLAQTRAKIDKVIAKYRQSSEESVFDILQKLSMETWEAEFSHIELGLRETIRLNITGFSLRKNISEDDVVIAHSGEAIPTGALVVYGIDDVHMNADLYPDPTKWDPTRYLQTHADDKKIEHGYLGWGSGIHPCLGMRFAKIVITISTVVFLQCFDFELCDEKGVMLTTKFSGRDRNDVGYDGPKEPVYFKCSRRC